MRISIGADTNILFSALFYSGVASRIAEIVETGEAKLYLSEYIRDELIEICIRKSANVRYLPEFYQLENVHSISNNSFFSKQKFQEAKAIVRDEKDIPVYLFAKRLIELHKIDYFITGDDDLLTEKVRNELKRKIISLKEFLEVLQEF